jgi:hypothetical protein
MTLQLVSPSPTAITQQHARRPTNLAALRAGEVGRRDCHSRNKAIMYVHPVTRGASLHVHSDCPRRIRALQHQDPIRRHLFTRRMRVPALASSVSIISRCRFAESLTTYCTTFGFPPPGPGVSISEGIPMLGKFQVAHPHGHPAWFEQPCPLLYQCHHSRLAVQVKGLRHGHSNGPWHPRSSPVQQLIRRETPQM